MTEREESKDITNRNERFIYDEKSSKLYGPDGTFLKRVFCPKALNWNQLIVEEGEDRWRGCGHCQEKVLNLDVADVATVVAECSGRWNHVCVHATAESGRVIFLRDPEAPPQAGDPEHDEDGVVVIRTARGIEDINRAVGLGYWPDVRFVVYDTENIRSKISIGQDLSTGLIEASGDYRRSFRSIGIKDELEGQGPAWIEAIPFTDYYPNYQESPIAAYLVPRDLPDGTPVIVEDPIEDVVGSRWNQGSAYRAARVRGYVVGRKVVLESYRVRVAEFIG